MPQQEYLKLSSFRKEEYPKGEVVGTPCGATFE